MALPYENSTSGTSALTDAEKILRRFGCTNFGVMTDWERGVVIVAFKWNQRQINLEASYRGYAALWLKENPWTYRRNATRQQWDAKALERGEKAVPSILRDWIKGQVTAVECGIMPFDHAFMPHMMLPSGERLIERAVMLLDRTQDCAALPAP